MLRPRRAHTIPLATGNLKITFNKRNFYCLLFFTFAVVALCAWYGLVILYIYTIHMSLSQRIIKVPWSLRALHVVLLASCRGLGCDSPFFLEQPRCHLHGAPALTLLAERDRHSFLLHLSFEGLEIAI
jgi:hypothetical protein